MINWQTTGFCGACFCFGQIHVLDIGWYRDIQFLGTCCFFCLKLADLPFGSFHKWGYPKKMVYFMDNLTIPLNRDDHEGYPYDSGTISDPPKGPPIIVPSTRWRKSVKERAREPKSLSNPSRSTLVASRASEVTRLHRWFHGGFDIPMIFFGLKHHPLKDGGAEFLFTMIKSSVLEMDWWTGTYF